MPVINRRLEAVFSRVTSLRASRSPVSDGLTTINEAEATSFARALTADGVSAASREAMYARVTGTAGVFGSDAARTAFTRGVLGPRASAARAVPHGGESQDVDILATIDGRERRIATAYSHGGDLATCVAGEGRYVLWATAAEAWSENVMIYDTVSRTRRRLVEGAEGVTAIAEAVAPNRSAFFVLQTVGGGSASPGVDIVDSRGRLIFTAPLATAEVTPTGVVITHFGEDDDFDSDESPTPDSKEVLSLASLPGRPVIERSSDDE